MIKFVAAGLAAFLLLLAGVALSSDQGAQAGYPDCFDGADGADADGLIDALDTDAPPDGCAGVTPSPSPSPSASPTASPSPTPATASATASASASASASAAPLPAAAPQTGGEPSGGSDTLLLTLILGAAATISVAGVLAGRYALERRS